MAAINKDIAGFTFERISKIKCDHNQFKILNMVHISHTVLQESKASNRTFILKTLRQRRLLSVRLHSCSWQNLPVSLWGNGWIQTFCDPPTPAVQLSSSKAWWVLKSANVPGFLSRWLQIPERPLDCRPPPRWTPRGGRGSWPGPALWVHPERTCLRKEDTVASMLLFRGENRLKHQPLELRVRVLKVERKKITFRDSGMFH